MRPPSLDRLAWCVIDGSAVFLDLAGDRYFRLPERQNRIFVTGWCRTELNGPHQPASLPLPGSWAPPERQNAAVHDGRFRIANVARALWTQRRVEHRLARHPLGVVLKDLSRAVTARADHDRAITREAARDIRAFQQARLLRSAADRCLPRSIALALCLAGRQCHAQVVLGVKLAPFAAHCWVQYRSEVLNDELEEVLRYTPILVI